MMETRVCNKCGEEKELTEKNWRFRKSKKAFVRICRVCEAHYSRLHYDSCKESILEYQKLYRKTNKNKIEIWKSNNRIKKREYDREAIKQLNDSYIRKKLKRKAITISDEMIKLKRQQLLLKRNLKKIKEVLNGPINESVE